MQPSPLLIIACGCFCTVEADLSGQDKDHKAKHTNCLASYRKSLLTPALKCASELPTQGVRKLGYLFLISCPSKVECCSEGQYVYGQNKSKKIIGGAPIETDTVCKELAQYPAHSRLLIKPVPFAS